MNGLSGAGVASAAPGVGDHQVGRSPGCTPRAAAGLLGPARRRWSPSDAGPDRSRHRSPPRSCHSRPLAAWNVSSSTPATAAASVNGLVAASQARSATPSPSGWSRRKSSTAAATRRSGDRGFVDGAVRRRRALERVVGPGPQLRRRRQHPGRSYRRGRAGSPARAHSRRTGTPASASARRGRASCWCVRASTATPRRPGAADRGRGRCGPPGPPRRARRRRRRSPPACRRRATTVRRRGSPTPPRTWRPAATICGVQRRFVGRRTTSMPGRCRSTSVSNVGSEPLNA